MTTATRLQVMAVTSRAQINCMRIIRNSGSSGYSGPDVQIDHDAQQAWWFKHASAGEVYGWLYLAYGNVVGFGMILKRADGQWSPSAGILPEHQGRGYGKWVVSNLVDQARHLGLVLTAKAKRSNPPAVATHDPALWEQIGLDDDYVYFRSLD